jgi:hypothetical protein
MREKDERILEVLYMLLLGYFFKAVTIGIIIEVAKLLISWGKHGQRLMIRVKCSIQSAKGEGRDRIDKMLLLKHGKTVWVNGGLNTNLSRLYFSSVSVFAYARRIWNLSHGKNIITRA